MSDQAGRQEPSTAQRPKFDLEQEIRFAVVMYGGVSLAIYINGVAQELFRLVRATAPVQPYAESELEEPQSDEYVYFPTRPNGTERPALTGSELVYRQLGQLLGTGGPPLAEAAEMAPVRTRFVVDIISGTSAGGINGVLLGMALANQQDFSVSADLWRDVADIDTLLTDRKPDPPLPDGTPTEMGSLLNGYLLYWEARKAMQRMAGPHGEEVPENPWVPSYAEQLDLAVTATDLTGLPLPMRLTDRRVIDERSHRKVFRFSYGTEKATGEKHTDFKDLDLMLGFAARATSSFPFAFEPVLLDDVRRLEQEPPDAERIDGFFADHVQRGLSADRIAFADGGYLDNKPFSYATESLRNRRADVPVDRKLLYIEPHPIVEAAPDPAAPHKRPDVIGNVIAAATLPGRETIRADVAAVGERNLVVGRLRDLELDAERALDRADPLEARGDTESDAEVDAKLGAVGPQYAAYRALRVRTVLDALSEVAMDLRGTLPGDEPTTERDVRDALRTWIEANYDDRHRAFLARYDTAFVRRRAGFLSHRVNDLLRRGSRAARMLAVASVREIDGAPDVPDAAAILANPRESSLSEDSARALAAQDEALRRLKLELNEALDGVRRANRALRTRNLATVFTSPDGDAAQADRFRAMKQEARALPGDAAGYMRAVGEFVAGPLETARDGLAEAPAKVDGLAAWLRELLGLYDRRFEAFDMIVLPLAYPDLGETNTVDIVRISPLDAPGNRPEQAVIEANPTLKLAGIRLAHFGGFLNRAWRENDLMWGRLDAAEVIVDTVLQKAPDDQRARLREQAQAAILREDLRGDLRDELESRLGALDKAPDKDLVAAFRAGFRLPEPLDDDVKAELLRRGVATSGDVLARALKARKLPGAPLKTVTEAASRVLEAGRWVKQTAARAAGRVRDMLPFARKR